MSGAIQFSGASFSQKSVQSAAYMAQFSQVQSDASEVEMDPQIRTQMNQVLTALQRMYSGDTTSVLDIGKQFSSWVSSVKTVDPDVAATLEGSVFFAPRSVDKSRSFLGSDGTLSTATKDELEALIRGILKGGIEDMKELRDLVVLLSLLGMRIDVNLLLEIKQALQEFAEDMTLLKGDLSDYLSFLQQLKTMMGPLLGENAVNERSIVQTFFSGQLNEAAASDDPEMQAIAREFGGSVHTMPSLSGDSKGGAFELRPISVHPFGVVDSQVDDREESGSDEAGAGEGGSPADSGDDSGSGGGDSGQSDSQAQSEVYKALDGVKEKVQNQVSDEVLKEFHAYLSEKAAESLGAFEEFLPGDK